MRKSSRLLLVKLVDIAAGKRHTKGFSFFENGPRMVDAIMSVDGSGTGETAPRSVFRDFGVKAPYQQRKVGGYRRSAAVTREQKRRTKLGLLSDSQVSSNSCERCQRQRRYQDINMVILLLT